MEAKLKDSESRAEANYRNLESQHRNLKSQCEELEVALTSVRSMYAQLLDDSSGDIIFDINGKTIQAHSYIGITSIIYNISYYYLIDISGSLEPPVSLNVTV